MSIKTWFTSDTHFGHTNIIRFCNLPYANADDMDRDMIDNWNALVDPEDIVFHLGDVSFHKVEKTKEILNSLNGRKHLIKGNHDHTDNYKRCFHSIQDYLFLKNYNGYGTDIALFHYPIESWNKKYYNSLHLHGHSHGTSEIVKNRFDVWTGNYGMKPVLLEDLLELVDRTKN
jgi:calcineurin-like phosphoesterase family protein